ncbi:MAG: metallopeptidase family protein [bacterium]
MSSDHQNRRLWQRLQAAADEEVEALVRRMPAELRDKARTIAVTYEPVVSQAMLDDDQLEPDLLGLFVGDCYAEVEAGVTDLPPQILLFLMSLWDYADHLDGDFREQVRRTYLHELGHYLGLDEGDLEARDLD